MIKGDVGLDTAQVFISAFLIVIVGFLVCAGALRVPLQGDDMGLIAGNDALHRVTTFPQALDARPDAPLALLGLAVNWRMFGGVLGLHLVSLLLHLGNGVLLYLICRKLMRVPVREPMAMATGMIFLLHPLATEGFCYLTARPSVQGAFFGLFGLLLFLRAVEAPPRTGHLAAALFCAVLAFGSMNLLLVVPLLFLGADLARAGTHGVRARAVFHLASLGGMVALAAARAATGGSTWGPFPEGFGATLAAQSVYADVPGLHYPLLKLLAPMQHISAGYPDAATYGLSVTGLVVLIALACLAGWTLYQEKPIGAALWWMLVTVAAAPCLIPLDTLLAERHAYFFLAGVALAVGLLLDVFRTRPASYLAGGLAALAVLGCGFAGFLRTEAWRNADALWAAAAQGPGAENALLHRARYSYQVAVLTEEETARQEALAAALSTWTDVRDVAKGDMLTEALQAMGVIHHQMGEDDAALPLLEDALRRDPFLQEAGLRIAMIQSERGRESALTDAMRRAVDYFQFAQRLHPLPPETLAPYALALAARGDVEVALPIVQAMTADAPSESPAMEIVQRFQAMAAILAQRDQEAAKLYEEQPGGVASRVAMAQTYLERNRLIPALYLLDRALDTFPDDAEVWAALGQTKALMDDAAGFIARRGAATVADEAAWRALALRCGAVMRWDAAQAYLEHAAATGRLTALPQVALGELAQQMGLTDQAHAYFEAAAEAHPANPAPWLGLCDLALAAEDKAEASRCLAEAEQRGAPEEELAKRRGAGVEAPVAPTMPERTVIR